MRGARIIAAAAAVALVCLCVVSSVGANRPLETAVLPVDVVYGQEGVVYPRAIGLGMSAMVIDVGWSSVVSPAAGGAPDFNPTDPASPYYDWSAADTRIRAAVAQGLSVIGLILTAPDWALVAPAPGEPRTLPSPQALADFTKAAALRYSGTYSTLPRVAAWKVWNEPNITPFFKPQFLNGEPFSPGWYRTMVNQSYDAVKSVAPSALVVAGGLAPFYDNAPETVAIDPDWGPLSFMRHLFCLSETLQPTCANQIKFDVWAAHPYTEGGPEHRAALPNDVSLPELPKMRALLQAAKEAGHLGSSAPLQFWVTEFSWDSSPPDALATPDSTLMRWVPESLHNMWLSGVSLVTWFTFSDFLPSVNQYQSGLALADGTPKSFANAFAFPLVGTSHRNQLEVWGRTPGGRQADVTIQRSVPGGWSDLGTLASDADGIFLGRFKVNPTGSIRALAPSLGSQSSEFPLGADPEVNTIYPAFGGPMLEPDPAWSRPLIPAPPTGGSARRIEVQQRLQGGTTP